MDAVVLAVWREGGGRVVGEELKSGVKLGGGGATGAAGVAFGGGARIGGEEGGELEKAGKSRVRINVPSGDVEADVVLRVGSVLLMPYFAVGGMVCVALEMGIGKAEGRRRERERGELVKDGSGGAGRISVAGNVADGGSEGEDEGDGEVGGDATGMSPVYLAWKSQGAMWALERGLGMGKMARMKREKKKAFDMFGVRCAFGCLEGQPRAASYVWNHKVCRICGTTNIGTTYPFIMSCMC